MMKKDNKYNTPIVLLSENDFKKRLLIKMLRGVWGIFVYLYLSLLSIYAGFFLISLIVVCLLSLLLYYFYKESILYVSKISVVGGKILLEYSHFDQKGKKIEFLLKNSTISVYCSVKGLYVGDRLIIEGQGIKIVQYAVGGWTLEKMLDVKRKLDEIANSQKDVTRIR